MSDHTVYKIGCICGIKSEYVAAQAFVDEEHDRPDTEKVDVDSNVSNGRTTLLWAAKNGHEAVVKLLLDTEKEDIDSKYSNGRTPLSWAVVKLLDTGKVDVNSKDSEYSWTPLLWAAKNGHQSVVKLLLNIEEVR